MYLRLAGIGAALASAIGVTVSQVARAEPYLAVRTGLKCSQCHVNRSGGGGRSDFGSAWAQTQLPMRTVGIRSRSLNDWVSIGFDLRALGSGTLNQTTPRTAFDISEAQIQVEARFIPNRLALYVDETIGPSSARAREAFALVERLPLNGYAKAGKFLLPYGWRLWDDEAFIRSVTGFSYSTPDLGVEVGIEQGPLSWVVAVTNGSVGTSESNNQKMITSSAVLVFPRFRVGASGSRNSGPDSRAEIVGAFGGFTVGPLTVLGEADFVFNSFAAQADIDQFVAYVEGDLLVHKGVNVKATHGFHDPSASVRTSAMGFSEDQRARSRVGVEAFPVSFVQLSAFYTRLDNAGDADDVDRLSLEVHLHF